MTVRERFDALVADASPAPAALDAPWADLNGRPLDNRRLSKMLGEYMTADNEPIRSSNIRTAGGVLKGFFVKDLEDAWARYCPPPAGATSATPLQPSSEPLNL